MLEINQMMRSKLKKDEINVKNIEIDDTIKSNDEIDIKNYDINVERS